MLLVLALALVLTLALGGADPADGAGRFLGGRPSTDDWSLDDDDEADDDDDDEALLGVPNFTDVDEDRLEEEKFSSAATVLLVDATKDEADEVTRVDAFSCMAGVPPPAPVALNRLISSALRPHCVRPQAFSRLFSSATVRDSISTASGDDGGAAASDAPEEASSFFSWLTSGRERIFSLRNRGWNRKRLVVRTTRVSNCMAFLFPMPHIPCELMLFIVIRERIPRL